MVIAKALQGTI